MNGKKRALGATLAGFTLAAGALVGTVASAPSASASSCSFAVTGGGTVQMFFSVQNRRGVNGVIGDVHMLLVNHSNKIVDPTINRFVSGAAQVYRGPGDRIGAGNSTSFDAKGAFLQGSVYTGAGTNYAGHSCGSIV